MIDSYIYIERLYYNIEYITEVRLDIYTMASRAILRSLRVSPCTKQTLLGSSYPSLSTTPCQMQNIIPCYQSRALLTPPKAPEYQTLAEVIGALSGVIGGPSTYDPELYNKMREELVDILPKSQSELPARRMIDSYDSAIIPIGSDPTLRDRYLTHHGGVRIGRLLEDMDIFAVHLGRASHLITRVHEIVFSFQTCDEPSPKRRHGQPLLYCHRVGGSNRLHRENAVGL